MTLFDVIAGLILLVSAAIGFVRGATRELVTMLAFLIAAAMAVLSLRFTGPLARNVIDPDWAALAVAILIVFTLVYILLRVIGGRMTERVQQAESFSMVDRAIGVGFGLIRALVLLGVFNLVFNAATPAERSPAWVTDAVFYPLTEAAGKLLMAFAPKGSAVADAIKPAIERAVRQGSGETPDGEAYDERERSSVDELVEKAR